MRSLIFIIGILGLVAWEAGITHMDYCVRVTDYYDISNSPYDNRWAVMSHADKGPVIDNVTGYTTLKPGIAVGSSSQGYFIAVPDGTVTFFDSEPNWWTACYELTEAEPGGLIVPSRTESVEFWKLQMLVMAVTFGWLFLFRPRTHRRSPTGCTPDAAHGLTPAAYGSGSNDGVERHTTSS